MKKALALLLLAVAIRLVFSFVAYRQDVMADFSDDKNYWRMAVQVVEQGPRLPDVSKLPEDYVAPGLAWYMGTFMGAGCEDWLCFFILHSWFGGVTVVLIYWLASRWFGERVGLAAGFWACLYPTFIIHVPTAGKEVLLTILMLTNMALAWVTLQCIRFNWKVIAMWSLSFCLLIHLDERYLAYLALFGGLMGVLGKASPTVRLQHATLFASLVLVGMIPWTVRNYQVYGKVIILTKRLEHLTDPIFGYEEKSRYAVNWVNTKRYLSEAQVDSVVAGTKTRFDNGKKIQAEQIEAMRKGILPRKYSTAEQLAVKFYTLWKPLDFKAGFINDGFKFEKAWSWKHNLAVGLSYGLLLPFFFVGSYQLLKVHASRQLGTFLLSLLLFHTFIHVVIMPFVVERYRMPIEPFVIMVGMTGFFAIMDKVTQKKG